MNIRDEANMLFQQNFNIDLIYTNTYYVLWWNICLLHLIPITRQKTIFKESMQERCKKVSSSPICNKRSASFWYDEPKAGQCKYSVICRGRLAPPEKKQVEWPTTPSVNLVCVSLSFRSVRNSFYAWLIGRYNKIGILKLLKTDNAISLQTSPCCSLMNFELNR